MSYIVPQKMPLRCFECAYISSSTMDGYSCKVSNKSLASEHGINTGKPNWCPLIEIPTPHGRLIDADKLLEKAYWDYNEAIHDYNNFKIVSYYEIVDAPTVIKAEG